MSQEIINWISALAGLVAAGGGLWAARAAHQSAVTAQEAARHAESVERRAVLRDLVATAHSVIAESMRINALVEEVKIEIRTLARYTGNVGGSSEKLVIEEAETKHSEILPLHDEAQKLIEGRSLLTDASEEDLTQALSKFDGYLIRVRRVKDDLEREVASLASQNRVHYESRINALNQSS